MKGFQVKIENVVAFTALGKPIPLIKVAKKLDRAEYNPESFPGVIYRVKDPRAATLIFSSGKIVCTGAKSVEMAKKAMKQVVNDMRKLGVNLPTKFKVSVENLVASTQIVAKKKLNLEEISFALENVEYEPEQFPGLVCRISEPRVAFLLFGTGKIICTGARKIEDIHAALAKFRKKLEAIGVKATPVQTDSQKDPNPPKGPKKS